MESDLYIRGSIFILAFGPFNDEVLDKSQNIFRWSQVSVSGRLSPLINRA